MIAIVGLLVFILCLASIIVIQYLMLRVIERGGVRSYTSFDGHPNCRCIPAYGLQREAVRAPIGELDPRIWNPNASAWMHSGPGGTIDLDAVPVKK